MAGRKAKDYTGQKIGKLTVLCRDADNQYGQIQVKCRCDCGNIVIRPMNKILLQGAKHGCGCGAVTNITGKRFGKLVAVALVLPKKSISNYWHCKCDCGGYTEVAVTHLMRGKTLSCGCMQGGFTHGLCRTQRKEYSIWQSMKHRCLNKSNKYYYNYGGRGIAICPEWIEDFAKFFKDMGPCPVGLTLERNDNDKNYSPDNCRWATRKEQSLNRRCMQIFEYAGRMWAPVEFCEKYNIVRSCLYKRMKLGWSFEEIIQGHRHGKMPKMQIKDIPLDEAEATPIQIGDNCAAANLEKRREFKTP